jgi:hypothetical protein
MQNMQYRKDANIKYGEKKKQEKKYWEIRRVSKPQPTWSLLHHWCNPPGK